jgi:uncharacterized membrane protein YeiH
VTDVLPRAGDLRAVATFAQAMSGAVVGIRKWPDLTGVL